MPSPFALLPLALAAGGGSVDEFHAGRLVTAGLTLLQRCVPLVRTLSARRSAILLPPSPHYLVALAASDGRGAVLVDPETPLSEIAHRLAAENVGAVFTIAPLANLIPPGMLRVLLDDMPAHARVVIGGITRTVDLGSHIGMALVGEIGVPGTEEEAVVIHTSTADEVSLRRTYTHRVLLELAREAAAALGYRSGDCLESTASFADIDGLTIGLTAPLIAGATILTRAAIARTPKV